jgi:hypothetical protein
MINGISLSQSKEFGSTSQNNLFDKFSSIQCFSSTLTIRASHFRDLRLQPPQLRLQPLQLSQPLKLIQPHHTPKTFLIILKNPFFPVTSK